jgi:chromosome segregation ATPase
MSAETWAQVGLTGAAAIASAFAGRAARRSKRQENRDDFTAVSQQQAAVVEQQGRAIERLERRVEQGEVKAAAQQERLAECDEAIAWLLVRIRDLVGAIRKSDSEPPAPRPMSARAARVLERSDM